MNNRHSANGYSFGLEEGSGFQPQLTLLRCSFCGLGEGEVARLFEGRDNHYICNECVDVSVQLLADYHDLGLKPPMLRVPWYRRLLRGENAKSGCCSFCGAPQAEGERLLASQEVQICEKCIRACEAIKTGAGFGM
ncbi:MAG TPA: ClpX C4-type zinc finger protein [Blastocatellia bacterium]|nr:ClpX C4-type zinc finger protein [Blastocatellia bacterium]